MPNDNGYGLPQAIELLRLRSGVPVVTGLPFGHRQQRATLPVGAAARLIVRGTRATLAFEQHPVLR
jgi:muramoyltetrapeptide carboxypeptidase